MKIAFTSCMNIVQRPHQPVWQQVANQQPDFLLLLGDSVYADVPWPTVDGLPVALTELSENAFMAHLHGLYQRQLAEPNFASLIRRVPTYAIWDDHDFLGNNSQGCGIAHGLHGHVRATRALFNSYCEALAAQNPEAFPATPHDAALWRDPEPAPGYRCVALRPDVHLHLLDGRSHKSWHKLLGEGQRSALERNVTEHPQALHLVASPIVLEDSWPKESWRKFKSDRDCLLRLAHKARVIFLSGDIHENRSCAHALDGGRILHEFTASGAAIDPPLRWPGQPTHNFGLLELRDDTLVTQFFSDLAPAKTLPPVACAQR